MNECCNVFVNGSDNAFCLNRPLCPDRDCPYCFYRSFASHYRNVFWSQQNAATPRECLLSSPQKYWFLCSHGHHFVLSITNITQTDCWCPFCFLQAPPLVSFTETETQLRKTEKYVEGRTPSTTANSSMNGLSDLNSSNNSSCQNVVMEDIPRKFSFHDSFDEDDDDDDTDANGTVLFYEDF